MKFKLDKNYHSLDRAEEWDESTRSAIKKRLDVETKKSPSYSFLTEQEGIILEAIINELLPGENGEERINIAAAIDKTLSPGKSGVRYGNEPWKSELYRQGIAEFLYFVNKQCGSAADIAENDINLGSIIGEIIEAKDPGSLFKFLHRALLDSAAVYYSHPAAWSQIGFPGPAYPEGYGYLRCDQAEKWEPKYEKDL